jgi:hypothetical protein
MYLTASCSAFDCEEAMNLVNMNGQWQGGLAPSTIKKHYSAAPKRTNWASATVRSPKVNLCRRR